MVPAFKGLGYGMLLVRFYAQRVLRDRVRLGLLLPSPGFLHRQHPWADCGAMEIEHQGVTAPGDREMQRQQTTPTPTTTAPAWTMMSFAASLALTANDSTVEEVEFCHNDTITKQFELYKRVNPY